MSWRDRIDALAYGCAIISANNMSIELLNRQYHEDGVVVGVHDGKCTGLTMEEDDEDVLWDADENCEHNIESQPGGGIKCTKYGGWFCY